MVSSAAMAERNPPRTEPEGVAAHAFHQTRSWRWVILVVVGMAAFGPRAGAQTPSFWANPSGGDWTSAANWSTNPSYPNNGSATYDATIDLAGNPYTVRLNAPVTIEDLNLNAASATLSHQAGALRINGVSQLIAGIYQLAGGTIIGGTWNAAPGTFVVTNNSNNRLDGVTFNGDLDLSLSSAQLKVANGLALNGSVLLRGSGSSLTFEGTQTFDNAAVTLDATTSGSKYLSVATGGTLTLGANARLQGGRGIVAGSGAIKNRGTISADAAGTTLEIRPTTLTNWGVIQVTHGSSLTLGNVAPPPATSWTNEAAGTISADSSTLTLAGNWSNAGTINAVNSTVNLRGSFTTAGLGTFNRTGGTVNLMGSLNNTGSTLALNATTGSWNFINGTITGGTINFADGQGLRFANNLSSAPTSTLNNVTVNGDITIDAFPRLANLRLGVGTTVNGTIQVKNNSQLWIDAGQTFDNTTIEVGIASSGDGLLSASGTGTLTLGPHLTVHAGHGEINGFSGTSILNRGWITADVSGEKLAIRPDQLQNEGSIAASNGATLAIGAWTNGASASTVWTNKSSGIISATDSTLYFGGTWRNEGAINIANSNLSLGGNFRTADIGTISRTSGTVGISGKLDNRNDTLLLNATTGSWQLTSGSITGGTVRFADGQQLAFTEGGGTLDGVTIDGDLEVSGYSPHVTITNGLQLTGNVLYRDSGYIYFDGGQTFDNTTVQFASKSGVNGGIKSLHANGSGTLTFGSNLVMHGGEADIGGNKPVTNRGLISADVAGQNVAVYGSPFTNQGTLEAINGGKLTIGGSGTSWSNTGLIRMVDSTLTFAGSYTTGGLGTISRTGGSVNLSGTLDNTANTLSLDSATGSWQLLGTMKGGTVTTADGAQLVIPFGLNAVLDGVTLRQSPISVPNGATVTIRNGLTLDGSSVTLNHTGSGFDTKLLFSGSQMIGGNGDVVFQGTTNRNVVSMTGSGTLTVGPGVTIHGRAGTVGSTTNPLVNQGVIMADNAGQTISVSGSAITNSGALVARDGGTVRVTSPQNLTNLQGGTLTGGRWEANAGSTLDLGSATITANAADVTLKGPGSTFSAINTLRSNTNRMTIGDGRDFAATDGFTNNGELGIGSASIFGVAGDLTQGVAGSLAVDLAGLAPGETFGLLQVLNAAHLAGGLSVSLVDGFEPRLGDSFRFLTAGSVLGAFDRLIAPTWSGNLSFDLVYNSDSVALTVVPEPATLLLCALGALRLLDVRRHRRPTPRA